MKALILNSFSLFPSVPPASTSFICGYLRSYGLDCSQLDINLETWLQILDPRFLGSLEYHPERSRSNQYPYCTVLSQRQFLDARKYVCRNIHYALNVLRNKSSFYDFSRFSWAIGVIYEAQCVIYHHYGVFIANHMIWWPRIGFEVQDLTEIYDLSRDRDLNPFISVYERWIIPKIKEQKLGIILMDIIFPWNILPALTLQHCIREVIDIHINFPGYGFDEFSFSRMRGRLDKDPRLMLDFDSIFLYRNDEGMLRLVRDGLTSENTSNIANLAIRKSDGSIQINDPCTAAIAESDPFPDYSDLPLSAYLTPDLVIIDRLSSRCFWAKCNYCSINARKTTSQKFSIERMMEKIGYYRQLGCNTVWLLDEACPPAYAKRFARELKKSGKEIIWSLRTRIDPELNRHTLEILYEAGLRELWVGLEQVDTDILRIMNKSSFPDEYATIAGNLLRNCAEVGIGLHFCLILGTPSETDTQRHHLVQFFEKHHEWIHKMPFFATFNEFSLMIDSPMYHSPEQFGITKIEDDGNRFNMEAVPYKTRWNDQTSLPQTKKKLEASVERLLNLFVPDRNMQLLWLYVSDSPWELLFKKHAASTRSGNPFSRKLGVKDKLLIQMYLTLSKIPWFSVYLKEFSQRIIQKGQILSKKAPLGKGGVGLETVEKDSL